LLVETTGHEILDTQRVCFRERRLHKRKPGER